MEPLKSNQAVLNVDMISAASTAQTSKKIKAPRFVPFEPVKAAVGPHSPEDVKISIEDRQDTGKMDGSIRENQTLFRYEKTVYIGRKTVAETPVSSPVPSLSPTDKFRPINVVDPIRHDQVSLTDAENHVVDIDESYSESRAVAHLQSVNEACNQKIVRLRDERSELKKELELQFQINAELKNLLVASMGDEMHHSVEMLVRQRTQLSSEIENYCKKIQDNQEALDKTNIMADMWRSKYIASRVMVDELASWKARVTVRYNEARHALRGLLNERHLIKTHLINALSWLQQIHSTQYKQSGSKPPRPASNSLIDLSKQISQLAQSAKSTFLGDVKVSVDARDSDDLTPAEKTAHQVLCNGDRTDLSPDSLSSHSGLIGRFHPDTRFELLTLNCCNHCKGDIFVV